MKSLPIKFSRLLALCVVSIFVLAGVAQADFVPTKWLYEKPVVMPPSLVNAQFVKVVLDNEVSLGARADLADIRIIANNNEEVPYQLLVENESVRNEYTGAILRDLSTQNGTTVFVLDVGSLSTVHDHLTIISDSKNYKRTVAVFASDTSLPVLDTNWRLLTDKGYIYNFSDTMSGFDAGSGEVYYPANTSRYLKVVIGGGEGSSVHVVGAHVLRLVASHEQTQTMSLPAIVTENPKYKTTEITLDLGGEGIPIRSILLESSDTKNFSRRAVVQSSSNGNAWVALGDGYVFSLNTPLFSGKQLLLPFRETRARYLRVLIMNEDDAPVSWGVHARVDGVVRSVVFQTVPGVAYSLYFGNNNAITPRYDISRYFQYIESTILTTATLGARTINPAYSIPLPPPIPFSETHALFLNGALVLLVALISLLTLSYLKKLKLSPRGPKEPTDSV